MASLNSMLRPSSMPPTRRAWLRRGVAALILVAAVVTFGWQERASRQTSTERLGVLDGAASPAVGQAAPDFVLQEQGTGRLVRLSDYRGKTVVLNFWATWCPPCIAEMPELQALHASRSAAGDLVVIAVDVEEPAAVAGEFVQQRGLTMPVLLDRTGAVKRHYGLPGMPGTFFIDRDGIVRAKTLGPVIGAPLLEGIAAAEGS